MDEISDRIVRFANFYVEEMLDEIDPDEERFDSEESLAPLVNDLALSIDGLLADWVLTKKQELASAAREGAG